MKKSFERAQRRREDGIAYKHDLGQHFLYDQALLRSLVAMAGVQKTDRVLEIGPGAGTLTSCLCEAAERVVAVEVDESVLPYLRLATEHCDHLEIIHADIRKVDLRQLSATLGEGFLVVANIPYNITTPILDLFWDARLPIRQMNVMIQKEVAQKLVALPGDPAYGLTSVRCRYFCEPKILAEVPASAFTPPPKVDSAFVQLDFRGAPVLPVRDVALLWRLIRAGFNQRRKTLLNAARSLPELSADMLRQALDGLGLPAVTRAETLTVEQWITLANALATAD